MKMNETSIGHLGICIRSIHVFLMFHNQNGLCSDFILERVLF